MNEEKDDEAKSMELIKYFSIIVVCRLFLLLVLIYMIAELGGIITLNVLGQVCQ